MILIYLVLLLMSCTPIYEETFYDEEEFIRDSAKIAQRKGKMENQFGDCSFEREDILQEGDRLTLFLHCPKRPEWVSAIRQISDQTDFVISQGQLSLPYIGSVETEGLTLAELKASIQESYQCYFPAIQVFLDFKKRKERFVSIIGTNKSIVPIQGEISLFQVLAQAELPSSCNLHQSYVMRQGEKLPIDLYQLVYEGSEKDNILMHGGDQIFIADGGSESVMVTGEVSQPGLIEVPNGGISLREALAQAGGISFTGSRNHLQVIRGNLVPPKVYSISWERMLSASNERLLLMPGDVVVVSAKPVTQWNRLINDLQPSLNAVQFIRPVK